MAQSANPEPIALDLAILTAMAHEMKTYLLSNLLFWQMDVRGPQASRYPRLTLGGFFLRDHTLNALAQEGLLSPAQQQQLAAAEAEFDAVRHEWQVAFETKLGQELKNRINAWAQYLSDCQSGDRNCADDWKHETEVRTMIELLLQQADERPVPDLADLKSRLAALDAGLRNMFWSGPFVWDPKLSAAYPRDRFWWLYGKPRAR